MKLQRNIFASLLLLSIMVLGFTSCSDDDDNNKEDNSIGNVYVLSSGGMGSNSATLIAYNAETGKTNNIFENVNGVKLGDTGQDMIYYGSKLYVSLYNSGIVYVLDNTGKKLAEIKDDSEKLQPRMFEAYNGKVYVTSFDGYIARIDTTSLTIDKKVAVGPNPEFVKVVNNKVYVANSGGLNWQSGYNNTVSILNPDLSDKKDIEVAVNPVELDVDKYNNLYLISRGNYGDVPNTLQSINTTSNEVKVLDTGRSYSMFAISEKLYLLKKEYVNSKPTSSLTYWDIASSKIVEQSFITDGQEIADISYVTVDPKSGNYYVAAANGSNTGDVYIFSAGGKFISKFDTGAAYPMKILFIYK